MNDIQIVFFLYGMLAILLIAFALTLKSGTKPDKVAQYERDEVLERVGGRVVNGKIVDAKWVLVDKRGR